MLEHEGNILNIHTLTFHAPDAKLIFWPPYHPSWTPSHSLSPSPVLVQCGDRQINTCKFLQLQDDHRFVHITTFKAHTYITYVWSWCCKYETLIPGKESNFCTMLMRDPVTKVRKVHIFLVFQTEIFNSSWYDPHIQIRFQLIF